MQSGAGSIQVTCALPIAPTVGNLLVLVMAGDKNTGALTLSGFTQRHAILGASVSLYMAYRVSDGTGQIISPVWANSSPAGNTAWYAELQDTAVTGITYWQESATPASLYSESATQARSSGTTGITTAAGLAIAAWAVDDDASLGFGVTRAYSNSFTEVVNSQSGGSDQRAAVFGAVKSIAQGAAAECTFSYSGFGAIPDQIAGCIAVFSKLAEVKGYVTGTVAKAGTATGTVTHAHGVVGSISSGTVTGSVSAAGSVTGTVAQAGEVEGESS